MIFLAKTTKIDIFCPKLHNVQQLHNFIIQWISNQESKSILNIKHLARIPYVVCLMHFLNQKIPLNINLKLLDTYCTCIIHYLP